MIEKMKLAKINRTFVDFLEQFSLESFLLKISQIVYAILYQCSLTLCFNIMQYSLCSLLHFFIIRYLITTVSSTSLHSIGHSAPKVFSILLTTIHFRLNSLALILDLPKSFPETTELWPQSYTASGTHSWATSPWPPLLLLHRQPIPAFSTAWPWSMSLFLVLQHCCLTSALIGLRHNLLSLTTAIGLSFICKAPYCILATNATAISLGNDRPWTHMHNIR